MIFDRHANLNISMGIENSGKGFVDTVGRNKKVIEEYIRNQLQEDVVAEQNDAGRVCRSIHLVRIQARCIEGNIGSRVMEKIGMSYEGR